jgi:hypothetical protein
MLLLGSETFLESRPEIKTPGSQKLRSMTITSGNPAILFSGTERQPAQRGRLRPVVFRPHLAVGLAFTACGAVPF